VKYAPATDIGVVASVCQCKPSDVIDAARLYGWPVFGGIILKSAADIPEDFPAEVRRIAEQNRRQAARQSAKAALNREYPR
jgi:hypothetical protein